MLAFLYLGLSFFWGYCLLSRFVPLSKVRLEGQDDTLDDFIIPMIIYPGAYVIGSVVMTTLTYCFARIVVPWSDQPLVVGNMLTVSAFFIYIFVDYVLFPGERTQVLPKAFLSAVFRYKGLVFIVGLQLVLFAVLFLQAFHLADGQSFVGKTIAGDMGYQMGLMRSFARGGNLVTEFPLFPGQPIRMDFLNLFMTGNLAFLGLRLDVAYNFTSLLFYAAVLLLLFNFAVLLTARRGIGILAILLFPLRLSFAYILKLCSRGQELLTHSDFLAITPYEEWGIWTSNVLLSQRQFLPSFGLLLVILTVLLLAEKQGLMKNYDKDAPCGFLKEKFSSSLGFFVALGLLLASSLYWDRYLFLAAFCIIAVMSFFLRIRWGLWVLLIFAAIVADVQTVLITGTRGWPFSFAWEWGFLAGDKSVWGVLQYMYGAFGALILLVVAGFIQRCKAVNKWLLGFLSPLLLAFFFRLGPDLVLNYQFIFPALKLLNILVAVFLISVYDQLRLFFCDISQPGRRVLVLTQDGFKAISRILLCLFIFSLMATGLSDLTRLLTLNRTQYGDDKALTVWVGNSGKKNLVFLSEQYFSHPVLNAGHRLFLGWAGFVGRYGYDVSQRQMVVKTMYEAKDEFQVKELVQEHNIDFIIIDDNNRTSTQYALNEEKLRSLFPLVYSRSEQNLVILMTQ